MEFVKFILSPCRLMALVLLTGTAAFGGGRFPTPPDVLAPPHG